MNSLENPESKANLGRTRWVAGLGLLALLTFAGQGADASFSSPYSKLNLPGYRTLLSYSPQDWRVQNPDRVINVTLVCEEEGDDTGSWAGWFSLRGREARKYMIEVLEPRFTEHKRVNFVSDGPADGDDPGSLVGIYGTDDEGRDEELLWVNPDYPDINLKTLERAQRVPYGRLQYFGETMYNATGSCEGEMKRQNTSQSQDK